MYERTVELRLLQKIRTFTFSSRICSGLSETGFSIATKHKTWIPKKSQLAKVRTLSEYQIARQSTPQQDIGNKALYKTKLHISSLKCDNQHFECF